LGPRSVGMFAMPMRGPLSTPAVRCRRGAVADTAADSPAMAAIEICELEVVACFCALGFALLVLLVRAVPDFGALVASLEQFP
jgi:hypothetical protein